MSARVSSGVPNNEKQKHDAEGGVLLLNCFRVFGTPDET